MASGLPELPQDSLAAQRFSIEIDGVSIVQFQEISGTASELEVIELKENDTKGRPVIKKMIGAYKPPTITLKRAANASMDLWQWHKDGLDGKLSGARRNGSIVQYDFGYVEVARYNFTNAWVQKLTLSGLKAGENQPSVEEAQIVCETFERVK
jgi:phage tail-like protein